MGCLSSTGFDGGHQATEVGAWQHQGSIRRSFGSERSGWRWTRVRIRPRGRGACTRIGEQLGINPETLRGWVSQAEIDAGARVGTSTAEGARLAELERDNRELRRANAILRSASAFFAAELDRPSR